MKSEVREIPNSPQEINDYRSIKPEGDITVKESQNFWNKQLGCEISQNNDIEKNDKILSKEDYYVNEGKQSNERIEKLTSDYMDELREKSPCPETLESVDINSIEKVSSEDVAKNRSEFNSHRNKIIEQWEKIYNQPWPTYSEDIIGKNGKVVRHKGQRLEAHHIKPLSLGGENIGANITPMEYKDHNDHRGIHSNEGSYKKLQDYAKEMNQC